MLARARGCTRDLALICFLVRLCGLERLNLSHCEQLTDLCLEWINGSSISSLDMSGCKIQDRVSLGRLFCSRAPSWLRIANPARLQGLLMLKGVPLRRLALAGCRITDFGVEVIRAAAPAGPAV